MLFIAFMLNILKIRFDFLCSDTVLSGKRKVKTQHEETLSLCYDTIRKEKQSISEGKITCYTERGAGVWKVGCARLHLHVRKPDLGGKDLILPFVESGIS